MGVYNTTKLNSKIVSKFKYELDDLWVDILVSLEMFFDRKRIELAKTDTERANEKLIASYSFLEPTPNCEFSAEYNRRSRILFEAIKEAQKKFEEGMCGKVKQIAPRKRRQSSVAKFEGLDADCDIDALLSGDL